MKKKIFFYNSYYSHYAPSYCNYFICTHHARAFAQNNSTSLITITVIGIETKRMIFLRTRPAAIGTAANISGKTYGAVCMSDTII